MCVRNQQVASRLAICCSVVAIALLPIASRTSHADILVTKGGGTYQGELVLPDARPAVTDDPLPDSPISWQSPGFFSPWQFSLDRIDRILFNRPVQADAELPQVRCQFVGGDIVHGELIDIDDQFVLLQHPRGDELKLPRDRLETIYWYDTLLPPVYQGPTKEGGWELFDGGWDWREGKLCSSRKNSLAGADIGIPAKARIRLRVSWTKSPKFRISLGASAPIQTADFSEVLAGNKHHVDKSFSLLATSRKIFLIRELDRQADLAAIVDFAREKGRAHDGELSLDCYLNQETGECFVCSTRGELLAKLELAGPAGESIILHDRAGGLNLEELTIWPWSGNADSLEIDTSIPTKTVQGEVKGRFQSFDRDSDTVLLATDAEEDAEETLRIDELRFMSFTPSARHVSPKARVVTHRGDIISATSIFPGPDGVTLASPTLLQRWLVRLEDIATIISLESVADIPKLNGKRATLHTDHVSGQGVLAPLFHPTVGQQRFGWQPTMSDSAAQFSPQSSGELIYRAPAPPETPSGAAAQNSGLFAAVARAFSSSGTPGSTSLVPQIYLRNGDVFPGTLKHFDGEEVTFESKVTSTTSLSANWIRAAILRPYGGGSMPPPAKRKRLFTLPRSQRSNPPTHILRSTDDDFLRARLLSVDNETCHGGVAIEGPSSASK